MRFMSRAILCSSLFLLAACPSLKTAKLPDPECPEKPDFSHPELGTPAPRSGKMSVALQLHGTFFSTMVKSVIEEMTMKVLREAEPNTPQSTFSVLVKHVTLEQETNPTRNLVSIRFVPAVLKQGGGLSPIEREYKVRYVLDQYFTAPSTAKLSLKYEGVYGGGSRGAGEAVTCGEGFDLVDSAVLSSLYEASAKLQPFELPLTPVLEAFKSLGMGSTQITGLDFSTDQHFTLALTLNAGTPRTFRPDSAGPIAWNGSGASSRDWGIVISPSFLNSVTESTLKKSIADANAGSDTKLTLQSSTVTPALNKLTLSAAAKTDAGICGDVGLKVTLETKPSICRSELGACISKVSQTTSTDSLCSSIVSNFVSLAMGIYGSPIPDCVGTGKKLEFNFDSDLGKDLLYATDLNLTSGALLLTGKSQMMDQKLSRSVVTSQQCPWDN
jgi:hypothetical protein